MKLAFVTQESGRIPSGVMTVVQELCRGWGRGDRITLLTSQGCRFGEMPDRGDADVDVARIPFPLPSDWGVRGLALKLLLRPLRWLQMGVVLCYLAVWLRRRRIEGVLSHNGGWPGGELNRLAIYAAWLTRIPRFLVIHNTPWQAPSPLGSLYRSYGRLVGRLATRVITVSNDCRHALKGVAGFGEVDVIYNGISLDGKEENAGHQPDGGEVRCPWQKRYPAIGFVGELHPRKGIHILIEALGKVDHLYELVLVGNGDEDYTGQVREMAAKLSCPVHFLGFREDVQELYPWMDIVVLPSIRYESFGMVIAEAMRAGIPVICSDFGGMKEVVVDGETGVVVPAGDVHALAVAIERLLCDEGLRRWMGKAGRERLMACFSSAVMIERYTRLFHVA